MSTLSELRGRERALFAWHLLYCLLGTKLNHIFILPRLLFRGFIFPFFNGLPLFLWIVFYAAYVLWPVFNGLFIYKYTHNVVFNCKPPHTRL